MRLKIFSIPQMRHTAGAFILLMSVPFLYSQLQVPIESGQFARPLAGSNLIYKSSTTESLSPHNANEIASSCAAQDSQLTKFRMKKSPAVAVLLSSVIPGAGQFYNRSYWKIPIIAGLAGYFGYEYINNNNKFKDYRDQYNATITPENPFGDENLKTLREFYRNQRDDFVWYFIIVYVVNLVDAYVDAHLFDFDVKEEKIIHYGKINKSYRLNFNFSF